MSFRIAEQQALKSTFEKHRLGATIVKGNRILSTGYNEIRYSGITKFSTVHAEEAAILKLLKRRKIEDLIGAEIYVTRFTKAGRVACSYPCSRCNALIRSVGISRIHYIGLDGLTHSESTH